MLTQVRISQYRCFREVDVGLLPLNVLIGPNNTGKSSFLSAVQLFGTAPERPAGTQKVGNHDLWRFDSEASPTIVGMTTQGVEVKVVGNVVKTPTGPNRVWVRSGDNSPLVPISSFDSSVFMPSMQSAGFDGTSRIPQIDDNAGNLPAYLDALLRQDRERFFQVLDTLKKLIPGLTDLNIVTPTAKDRRIDLKFEGGLVIDARHASYGVKLLIFFVALANHPTPPRTILIEEAETGVHPRRLKDIVELLIGLSEGKLADRPTQVFLTTHSPYLLDYIDPKSHRVLVFQRDAEGSCFAQPVDTDRLKLFLSEFMLGEVWLNQEEAGLVEKVQ